MDVPADQAQAARENGQARVSQRGGAARSAALWLSGVALVLVAAQPLAATERALVLALTPALAPPVASRCNLPAWHPRVDCERGQSASSLLMRLPPGHPPLGGSVALPPGHPPIAGLHILPPGHPPLGGMIVLPPGHPPIDELDQATPSSPRTTSSTPTPMRRSRAPTSRGGFKVLARGSGQRGPAAPGARRLRLRHLGARRHLRLQPRRAQRGRAPRSGASRSAASTPRPRSTSPAVCAPARRARRPCSRSPIPPRRAGASRPAQAPGWEAS